MEKVKGVIVMEGGMSFEFEGEEKEPVAQTEGVDRDPDLFYRVFRGLVLGPIQFVDVHDNQRPQVVLDHPHQNWLLQEEDAACVRRILNCHLSGALGHGLSTRELTHCVQQFTDLMHGLFNRPGPYNAIVKDYNDDNHRRSIMLRRFVFKIQRRGFWRSPYLGRKLAGETRGCPIHGLVRCFDDLGRFEHESYVVGDEEDVECPICFEGFGRGSEATAIRLACRHYFHRRCIARWISNHYTCPCCRFVLVPHPHPDPDTSPSRYRHPDPPPYWLYPPPGISLDAMIGG